jgi:aryl-alcohol dehydrogenase-like predicted oxidoreductase
MKYFELGRSGLKASQLGLGCLSMSGGYGEMQDDAKSEDTIRRAIDLGVTLFDTSMSYGVDGHNQRLLGRAVLGRRDTVVISSKFGSLVDDKGRRVGRDASPKYVRYACEETLKRIGIDVLDVLCLSRVDPSVPIEGTVGEMSRLIAEGKLRAAGLSECSAATLARAHAVQPITTLQIEYSLWTRDPEAEHLPLCRKLGIAVLAYAPLGRGFLAGAVRSDRDLPPGDHRHMFPRFQGENLAHNARLLAALDEVAKARRATPAQIALAWLLSRGPDVFPIPSGKQRRHLEENVAACDVTLAPAELARLEDAFHPGAARGTRYHPQGMREVNV